ncbi:hypothetical protein ACWKWZ_14005, partial [Metapseudomonas otitidis]
VAPCHVDLQPIMVAILPVPTFRTEPKAALRDRLANYKVPKYFELVHELPMLPVGKVDRLSLKSRAIARVAAETKAR